jgi:hypothetical protein
MAIALQFTLSNPAPGKDAEYNEWYSGHHAILGVLTPGVLAGQRFRRIPGPWPEGKHDYLMIWEFDDPTYALEQLDLAKQTEKLPWSDTIDRDGIQPPTLWMRAQIRNGARIPTESAHRGACVLMLANAAEGQDEAFEAALLKGDLAALADLPGVLSADFLTLADKQIRGNARKYRFALLFELYDEAMGIESLHNELRDLSHLDSERWLAPVFRPLAPKVTKMEAEHQEAAKARGVA